MKIQPMIVCRSVSESRTWYEQNLGLTAGHGGDEYEMLMADGTLVLQLHDRDVHEHPQLIDPDAPAQGNGIALYFETPEFDATLARIRASGATVVEDLHVNPLAKHRAIWLRDPNGFLVVVNSPYGDVG